MKVRFYLRDDAMGTCYPCMDSKHRDLDGTHLLNIAASDMGRADRQADIEVCRREGEGYVWGNSACLLFSKTDVRIGAHLNACSEPGNHVAFTLEQFDRFYADWKLFLTGVPEFEREY